MSKQLLANVGRAPANAPMMVIPAKYFSSYSSGEKASGECGTSTEDCKTKASDPVTRFQKRNAFMKRRHLQRDHIIRAQHYDIRIAAIRATETLQEAVKRHGMIREEARSWGGLAAGSALYASFLRGDERVKTDIAVMQGIPESNVADQFINKPGERVDISALDNRMYCESFAVGEIRGYAHFDQLRVMKHRMLFPEIPADAENIRLIPGDGVMRLTKVMYGSQNAYNTVVRATGNMQEDWDQFYRQSEQVPSHIAITCDVNDTPLDTIIGFPTENSENSENPDEPVALNPLSSPPAVAPGADPLSYLEIPVQDAEFLGAVLIQVLAGDPNPVVAAEILQERALQRVKMQAAKMLQQDIAAHAEGAEDAASEVKGAVEGEAAKSEVSTPESSSTNPPAGNQQEVEETDQQYVKRIQLERLRERAAQLDMRGIMTEYGVAAYVACLLGEDVEALAQRGEREGNVDREVDFEAIDKALIDSALREKEKQKANIATDAVAAAVSSIHEQAQVEIQDYKYHFQYRPVSFFCRCYQTKVEHKLAQMPKELLEDLKDDGGATFTCDFCNTKQEVSVEDLTTAIAAKK